MGGFRGFLFDFDGVVVDSTPIHLKGWSFAYLDTFSEELDYETLQCLIGRSTSAISRILSEKSGFPSAKAKLIVKKNKYLFDNLQEIRAINGAQKFFDELRIRAIPFGIVSNAPRNFISATLEHLQLKVPFFLGLENYQRPKPDAEPYMKGAQKIPGITFSDHNSIYVFEDSTHGIEAAAAAYMTPFGICSQHPPDTLIRAGAKECFTDLEDALKIFW